MQKAFADALPHGPIRQVFPDVFFVAGSFVKGKILRFSRNMIVVRDRGDLTLINTVRLSDAGLNELDELGTVRHVMKLGFYHGIDDPYYVDRYDAKLWAHSGHVHDAGLQTTMEMHEDGELPFSSGSLFVYRTAKKPEAVVHLMLTVAS